MRFLITFALFINFCYSQLPEGVGFGKNTTGGKNGFVYHVTNLNDSGFGSLRYGAETLCSTRTIVFDVSGYSYAATPIKIRQGCGNVTIAGETSPEGFVLYHAGIWVQESNVIISHLKIRPGEDAYNPGNLPPGDPNYEPDDALTIKGFTDYDLENIYFLNNTVSWGHDGLIDITASADNATTYTRNITVHSNLFYENIDKGYGSLTNRAYNITWYRNAIMFTTDRNIAISSPTGKGVEMINNFIYGTGRSTWYRVGQVNDFIGNVFVTGQNFTNPYETFKMEAEDPSNPANENDASIYQVDNIEDGEDANTLVGRAVGHGTLTPNYNNQVPIISSSLVESAVMSNVGANLFYDASDLRVFSHVSNRNGSILSDESNVGGYPTIGSSSRASTYDTDGDGMSDQWEVENFGDLSESNTDDFDSDGYTNLEEFLFELRGGVILNIPSTSQNITRIKARFFNQKKRFF